MPTLIDYIKGALTKTPAGLVEKVRRDMPDDVVFLSRDEKGTYLHDGRTVKAKALGGERTATHSPSDEELEKAVRWDMTRMRYLDGVLQDGMLYLFPLGAHIISSKATEEGKVETVYQPMKRFPGEAISTSSLSSDHGVSRFLEIMLRY